jgi:hypothetical protein
VIKDDKVPQKKLVAECTFENVSVDDLIDGLETLSGRYGQGVIVSAPGDGPDAPLAWALQDVSMASHETDAAHQAKLCTNAILNSRRALGCLVDWYIARDFGNLCKNPPGSPKQKADFLMRRGIIDELTSRVLARAIEKRNRVEHDYISPDLESAEDVVELLRRTMTAIRQQSDPSCGAWVFGIFLGGQGYGTDGRHATFGGWCDPLAVFMRSGAQPWVGIVLPNSETLATVRRTFMNDVAIDELLRILSLVEQKFGHAFSFTDHESCNVMARELGFTEGQ